MTALIFALIAGVLRTLCIMFGWNWFVAHPFSAPELGFWHSWALMLVVHALVLAPTKNILDNPTGITSSAWSLALSFTWAATLGLMWVIHYFLPL